MTDTSAENVSKISDDLMITARVGTDNKRHAQLMEDAHLILEAQKAKLAECEARLGKAVEMLILCGDMFDEVAHPSDPLSVMIKTTLVELEGKDHG